MKSVNVRRGTGREGRVEKVMVGVEVLEDM